MPGKPAPIKKSPAKKAPQKAAEKAPAPQPAPAEPPPAPAPEEPAPAPAPAEAPAEAAPAPAEAPAPEAPAPAEAAPAEAAPAEAPPAPEAEAPAEQVPAAAAAADAAAAVAVETPKAPTPPPSPPPAVPTSAPLDVVLVDVSESSVTIQWNNPERIGDSGLDGFTVEYRKDGASEWVAANAQLTQTYCFCIKNLASGDVVHVRVVAVNAGGRSEAGLLSQPVTVQEAGDRPRIRMPRVLRSRIVKPAGEQVNLVIPFTGGPKPVVSWLKDGQEVDTKRVNIRNSERDSILFIRASQREDSGLYQITVTVDSFQDQASLKLQIVELPGPPTSLKLVDSWGFNAALEWTPPRDDGNSDISGYTIQKADQKTGEWFTVLEHYHRLTATVSDLVMGNSYCFRVFAENQVGRSQTSAIAKKLAHVHKTGLRYKPNEYVEHDFTEAPKFTTALSDRAATVGYNTKLLCSVRGTPQPTIEWLKNQMLIGDDPKYRQISKQGICSLEIRKPTSFDGGVYTCRAKNPQGEAIVSCKLEVKKVVLPDAEKGK